MRRNEQLNHYLQKVIGEFINRDIELPPDTLTTVTAASVDKDRRQAKVWISVFPGEKREEIMELLNKNIYKIQRKANEIMSGRFKPRVVLLPDEGPGRSARVENIVES